MGNSIFVYEYMSAGGVPDPTGSDPSLTHLAGQGRAMRDAIVADLVQIEEIEVTCATVGDDRPVAAPQLRYTTARAGQTAREFVRAMARAHDLVWVIAPESDAVLATLAAAVPAEQWIGCDRDAIALASSKSLTARHLAQSGVAATRPWHSSDDTTAARWVVKPDDGAGACDTQVFTSFAAARNEQRRRAEHGQAAVLEPWVEGDALSVSMLCGALGAEVLAVNRQHIDVDGEGRVSYRGVSIDAIDCASPLGARIEAAALAVAGALPGLRGFVGCDVVAAAQEPVVIEVNPRPTCAYVGLSARLGRNLARDVLAMFRGDPVQRASHAAIGGVSL
jgi:predicted ATP-grasp superfamily ATP-dependent carboligase